MKPEDENAIASTARNLIAEFKDPNNTRTYRELLDIHSSRIITRIPAKHRGAAWLYLNCECHRVYKRK